MTLLCQQLSVLLLHSGCIICPQALIYVCLQKNKNKDWKKINHPETHVMLLSLQTRGTLKVVYRCWLTWKTPSESLHYTTSLGVRKMTSINNTAVLSSLVLHRKAAHLMERSSRRWEGSDGQMLFGINTHFFSALFTSQTQKVHFFSFLHFPINQIYEPFVPAPHAPALSLQVASEDAKLMLPQRKQSTRTPQIFPSPTSRA